VRWQGGEGKTVQGHTLRVGKVTLDTESHTLDVDGNVHALTPKQFQLLNLLMSHPGKTFTRKQIMKDVWETDYTGDTRTLDVHVHWLRQKLGDIPGPPRHILTVRRVGYRFVDPEAPQAEPLDRG